MIDLAYSGTRVIEMASGLSAGVAGRFFSDLGADVVRIEMFDESPTRPGERAMQTWARAHKRILSTGDGRQLGIKNLEPLVVGADVVITDLSPSRWSQSFPSPDEMVEAYPGTVIVDVTRLGPVGPHADYLGPDLVVLALSGYLFTCGSNDREPLRLGVDVVDVVTGVNAAGGAMVALHHARGTG